MRNLGCLLATVALLVACGPAEEIGPDAGEEVDASLDGALVEGQWMIAADFSACLPSSSLTIPSFDVEVESDGNVVVTGGCAGSDACDQFDVTVESSETLRLVWANDADNDGLFGVITVDAHDDGVTATASARYDDRDLGCETTDPSATVMRVRE